MNRQELPHNNEAEQAVLGAILLENPAINQASAILKPDDFYEESHRRIYLAMLEINEAGEVIDIVTLPNILDKKKELIKSGGVTYLTSLVNTVPNATNIKYHCRIVREAAIRRKVIEHARSVLNRAHEGNDLTDVITKTRNVLESVLNELTASAEIPLISSVDFMAQEADEIDWIVEGFIAHGTLNLLAGPSSGFKTWLSMYLGLCVAEGRDFIGRKTMKNTVLYIDRENPRIVWKQRLSRLGESDNLKLWTSWDEPPSLEKGIRAYRALAKEKPLMIFDSLIRFHNEEENEASGMSKVMDNLRALCQAGATVFVLHHMGKDEESLYRGSSEILGGVDAAYTLKPNGEKRLVLKGIKNRLVTEPVIPIKFVDENNRLSFKDRTGEELGKRKGRIQAIQELIKNLTDESGEPPNQSEIAKEANERLNFGRPLVLELLKEGEGNSWKRTRGQGHAMFYSILDEAVV